MAANTFGQILRLTTYGESHGIGIGGIIDGCPSGLNIDMNLIQNDLDRRNLSQSKFSTSRKENGEVEFLSGIFEGKTTGTPIGFIIRNKDVDSEAYETLKDIYRPSHADYTYDKKYGFRDHRGGGRSSARETVSRVVGGAIAKMLLNRIGVKIITYVSQIGPIRLQHRIGKISLEMVENSLVKCPEVECSSKMEAYLDELKSKGDTTGGIVSCLIENCPVGLGEPVFDKLHADLGKAMLSINAAKGFEYGTGFESASKKGSDINDFFIQTEKGIQTITNFSGGIQGGISNGMDIYFNVAFKPVSSISHKQTTIDKAGNTTNVEIKGRHDTCIVPRAVPIVEAMAALVIADHYLRQQVFGLLK